MLYTSVMLLAKQNLLQHLFHPVNCKTEVSFAFHLRGYNSDYVKSFAKQLPNIFGHVILAVGLSMVLVYTVGLMTSA